MDKNMFSFVGGGDSPSQRSRWTRPTGSWRKYIGV